MKELDRNRAISSKEFYSIALLTPGICSVSKERGRWLVLTSKGILHATRLRSIKDVSPAYWQEYLNKVSA